MRHHTLTLNYDTTHGFKADTDPLPVKPGDTISFQLGSAPSQSRFKITMNDPQFFSAGEVHDSHTQITVLQAVPTTYHCQLLDQSNKILFQSSEHQPGGGMIPDFTAEDASGGAGTA